MGDEMINRNPYEMKKFAEELEEYCKAMEKVCRKLDESLKDAQTGMKDDFSRKALSRTQNLSEELLAGIPKLKEIQNRLNKSAAPLQSAIDLL